MGRGWTWASLAPDAMAVSRRSVGGSSRTRTNSVPLLPRLSRNRPSGDRYVMSSQPCPATSHHGRRVRTSRPTATLWLTCSCPPYRTLRRGPSRGLRGVSRTWGRQVTNRLRGLAQPRNARKGERRMCVSRRLPRAAADNRAHLCLIAEELEGHRVGDLEGERAEVECRCVKLEVNAHVLARPTAPVTDLLGSLLHKLSHANPAGPQCCGSHCWTCPRGLKR